MTPLERSWVSNVNITVEGLALAVIAVCMVVLTFHWT
jgi:hypothetical protein